MLKLKMTGKNFSPGILKLLHIRFVENGFKLWYNYVNVNSICGYKTRIYTGTFQRQFLTKTGNIQIKGRKNEKENHYRIALALHI